jgi:hypothetical protein
MMGFHYQSGEEAQVGDCIKYHGEVGQVELVATELTGNPEIDWYVQEYPPGSILIFAENFGQFFCSKAKNTKTWSL